MHFECFKTCYFDEKQMQLNLEPTRQIVQFARSQGFGNVHDYLVHTVTGTALENVQQMCLAFMNRQLHEQLIGCELLTQDPMSHAAKCVVMGLKSWNMAALLLSLSKCDSALATSGAAFRWHPISCFIGETFEEIQARKAKFPWGKWMVPQEQQQEQPEVKGNGAARDTQDSEALETPAALASTSDSIEPAAGTAPVQLEAPLRSAGEGSKDNDMQQQDERMAERATTPTQVAHPARKRGRPSVSVNIRLGSSLALLHMPWV